MEIRLLSPVNNAVIEIIPALQNEILASLPSGDTVLENSFNWRAPVASDKENTTPRYINFCWGCRRGSRRGAGYRGRGTPQTYRGKSS